MASLKAKRGATRGAFTRTLNELVSEINKPQNDLNEIRRLKKHWEDRFLLLEKVDEEFDRYMQEIELTEEEYTVEYNSIKDYRDKYTDIISIVNNLDRNDVEQNNFDRASSATGSYHTNCNTGSASKYKLPKLELRKYNGDPKEWLGWWSQFKGIYEDVILAKEHKFQYLIQATIAKSPAYELVTSFPPTANNYQKAIDYLKSRFGNEKIFIEVYIRELLKLVLNNTIDRQGNSISSLYDKLETQLRGLESLGVTSDKYASMLHPLVESALPEDVLKTWQRTRNQKSINQVDNTEEDQLSLLMNFLRNEVDSEIHFKLAKTGIADNVHTSDSWNESVLQNVERSKFCFFCKKSGHLKSICRHYKLWLLKQSSNGNDTSRKDTDNVNGQFGKGTHQANCIKEKESNEEEGSEFLFSIGELRSDEWMLDSGATHHVCNDKMFFKTLDELYKSTVKNASGKNISVNGIGSGEMKFSDGNGKIHTATVNQVLYVPASVGNMLSVSRLTKLNFRIEFGQSMCELKYNNVQIGVADLIDGLYYLRQPHEVNVMKQKKNHTLDHRNLKGLIAQRKVSVDNCTKLEKIKGNLKEAEQIQQHSELRISKRSRKKIVQKSNHKKEPRWKWYWPNLGLHD